MAHHRFRQRRAGIRSDLRPPTWQGQAIRARREHMAAVEEDRESRYPRQIVHVHYDPEVDIAMLSFEQGSAVSEEHPWGLIDRDPEDGP